MNVLLIRPPRIKKAITLSDFMFSEPLGLEMIYGVIKDNHNVEIFDMVIETKSLSKKIKEFKPKLIGLTSLCIDVNMIKNYGIKNIFRILFGSIKAMGKYIRLMIKS